MRHAAMHYEVVSTNGHGVHSKRSTLNEAIRTAQSLAETYPIPCEFEIQQVVEYDNHARRYWMREGSRWVPWEGSRDHTERRPDWIFFATPLGRERA